MSQTLRVYQALWGMQGLGPLDAVGEAFDKVQAAGFDGMAIDLGALTWQQALATVPHFARTGLRAGLTAFPNSLDELLRAVELAQRIDAPFLVVIGQEMPLELPRMISVVERWMRAAEPTGMSLHFETHRNCITNDLFTTVQLLRSLPAMRLAADLSHYVVDREMPAVPTSALQALLSEVLARAESFQGRIAARGQIQIALNFAQNQKWVSLFKSWWLEGFAAWRLRHGDGSSMVFLCELGPPDYAITDGSGHELTDRWSEAQQLMRWAKELWIESSTWSRAVLTVT